MTGASQPPWSFINIWRYLQREYGIVSVGSFYNFGLQTVWEIDKKGHLVPARTPKEKGIELTNREEALRAYVDFKTKSLTASICTMEMIYKPLPLMAKDWSVEAVVVHANRGCEGSGLSCTEPRLDLLEQNMPVLTFEGSMADYRDFDLPKTMARVEAFLEGLGWGKLSKAS
jgi:benzoyl-CoA reductase subunit B